MILKIAIVLVLLGTQSAKIIIDPGSEIVARLDAVVSVSCFDDSASSDVVIYSPYDEEIDKGRQAFLELYGLQETDVGTYRCELVDGSESEIFTIRLEIDEIPETSTTDELVDPFSSFDINPTVSLDRDTSEYPSDTTETLKETTETLETTEYDLVPETTEVPYTSTTAVSTTTTTTTRNPYEDAQDYSVVNSNCGRNQFTCDDGQCVPLSGICDLRRDCYDGSDERNCPGPKRCEPNERSCNDGKCAPKFWFCDGERDCNDGSDEGRCPAKTSGDLCESFQFQCKRSRQCISKSFVCDGQIDCQDGSDEQGCTQPVIVRHPQRNIEVCVGAILTISCEARGFPVPYINWRLNWGHVPEPPRCSYTNENGIGVFTCFNVVFSDAGAYSCEAMSTKGRIFAIDAIVTVKDCGPTRPTTTTTTTTPRTTRTTTTTTSRPRPINSCFIPGIVPGTQEYGVCTCKCDYEGVDCSIRKQNMYVFGDYCHECFCNGLNVGCSASNFWYRYNRISEAVYAEPKYAWKVSDESFITLSDKNLAIGLDESRIPFVKYIPERENKKLNFLIVPEAYTGNMLTSYAGNMTFQMKFECPMQRQVDRFEIRLRGSNLALVAIVKQRLYANAWTDIVVEISEKSFVSFPNQLPIQHEQMRLALGFVDKIAIQAILTDCQTSVSIKNFNLDVAKRCKNERTRAYRIEVCQCPYGYLGLSCEQCDNSKNYARSYEGTYFGLCRECPSGFQATPRGCVPIYPESKKQQKRYQLKHKLLRL